ncbi:L-seryl-tRNA(Sec) selenium transferase [Campylobacter canadensis]|uniref:L-seryl-tRNA(Sec) selenium transferase n=1 Tax=Campylobacter canadensis TaxID=449520 RepID=A0ABS7WS98_9BACT|nr:L-seryl-tRNA(Sec) selenium transferase [Campylobacter canadensis]MBZ7986855.1 L-seryl-tRNA(Sec) selenium transferase [Campylobacter canadensis]MBZ7994176.1 L-seryl-tRNA(Sec) selenium transferase [Campylobacter canadensis]MBZ7995831.1 L-seryl-tRNA(Sec) selenium transferase [Campylobacter canadensis]MBZ7997892.1 L-seryl-tRNA(Sec) selenium transferase [Campylobacter canadensis]MBZ7999508.1 L-seryl-tRNA(Sec) selenium transferase [Campylobacter canadensis]
MLPQVSKLINHFPKEPAFLVSALAKQLLNELRTEKNIADEQTIKQLLAKKINEYKNKQFHTLINATGVVLHTNLGRALSSKKDALKLAKLLSENINLEFNVNDNSRGKRDELIIFYLKTLFNAQDALVVNNNAAAVFLILNTLAKDKAVLTSCGELVEIGGGFRISEVMKQSGANLITVGTTNKTKLKDYEERLNEASMILKTHKSNFFMQGFCEEVDVLSLNKLAKDNEKIFYYDLGSGYVDKIHPILQDEMSVKNLIKNEVSLLSFSADKLFASTQAGIILGEKKLIEQLRNSHLLRMFRLSKASLILLELSLKSYLEKDYKNLVSLQLILDDKNEVLTKAKELLSLINIGEIIELKSLVGAGSTPNKLLPSYGIKIPCSKDKYYKLLELKVVSNWQKDCVILDLRSVLKEQIKKIARIINIVFKG